MRIHLIVIAILFIITAQAQAEDDPLKQLYAARSLKCHFSSGFITHWSANNPETSTANNDQEIQFDSIDIRNQSARVNGKPRVGDIKVIVNDVGISFIKTEQVVMDITTVFPAYGEDQDFIAVDTRHVSLLCRSLAEQYYGTCKIWQQ